MSNNYENDFTAAIESSLQSAADIEDAHREIANVFEDVCNAISRTTNDRVIARLSDPRTITETQSLLSVVEAMTKVKTTKRDYMDPEDEDNKPVEFQAVVKGKESAGHEWSRKLFEVQKSTNGYPVVIRTHQESESCYDQMSLIKVIRSVLSEPRVGRMLTALEKIATKTDEGQK